MSVHASERSRVRRVPALVCLIAATLVALLPAIHHHPAGATSAAGAQTERSCALCPVLSGFGIDGASPFILTPPDTHWVEPQAALIPILNGVVLTQHGRAPPSPAV